MNDPVNFTQLFITTLYHNDLFPLTLCCFYHKTMMITLTLRSFYHKTMMIPLTLCCFLHKTMNDHVNFMLLFAQCPPIFTHYVNCMASREGQRSIMEVGDSSLKSTLPEPWALSRPGSITHLSERELLVRLYWSMSPISTIPTTSLGRNKLHIKNTRFYTTRLLST